MKFQKKLWGALQGLGGTLWFLWPLFLLIALIRGAGWLGDWVSTAWGLYYAVWYWAAVLLLTGVLGVVLYALRRKILENQYLMAHVFFLVPYALVALAAFLIGLLCSWLEAAFGAIYSYGLLGVIALWLLLKQYRSGKIRFFKKGR